MPTQTVAWNSISVGVDTPTGKMFVHILEEDGKPVGLLINSGKTGTSIAAWASTLASMVTTQLQNGIGLNAVIADLSQNFSDKSVTDHKGIVVRSGPDGVLYALLQYRREKFIEFRRTLDGTDDGFFD